LAAAERANHLAKVRQTWRSPETWIISDFNAVESGTSPIHVPIKSAAVPVI
jgi:hypothetical protein